MLKASTSRRNLWEEFPQSHRGSRARLSLGRVGPQEVATVRSKGGSAPGVHCPVLGSVSPFKFLSPSVPFSGYVAIRCPGPYCSQQVHHKCCIETFLCLPSLVHSRKLVFFLLRSIPGGSAFQHVRDFRIPTCMSFQNYKIRVQ